MKLRGFAGPSYESTSVRADAQKTVNLYPEVIESQTGKSLTALYSRPGMSLFGTLPTTPVRGLWAGDDRLFAVGGSTLYELTSGGVPTSLGSVGTDAANTPVQMFPNGNQLFIVSADNGYCDNGAGPVLERTARFGAFLDSVFLAAEPDSKKVFFSALNDGTSWDALDFITKEGYPDNVGSLLTSHSELWIWGESNSTEVWRNEADGELRRDPSAFIHEAIAAPWSVANLGSGPVWLGGDTRGRVVAYKAQGFTPVRISNHAVEEIWRGYSSVSDAYGWVMKYNGHTWWVLNFITGGATWVYDLQSHMWTEWKTGSGNFIGRCHAFVFGKHLIGDRTSGAIYQMTPSVYTDNGTAIEVLRRAPHVADDEKNVFHHSIQLDMETGEIADPVITLKISDDGGKTFGTGKTRTAGAISDYKKRVIWRRLGKARDRVYEISSSAALRHKWIDAILNASQGTA